MRRGVLRIFVSSTFQDFQTERDRMAAEVYPELEALCAARGVSLHVIDLRWGVSIEDAEENRTASICLDEIRRCQELSPDMNFLIMASDWYGTQMLPEAISPDEWAKLTDSPSPLNPGDYYIQDLNDIGERFILRPRRETGHSREDERQAREILERLAAERLSPEAARKYGISVTEQEIDAGYLSLDPDAESRKNTFLMIKVRPEALTAKMDARHKRGAALCGRLEETVRQEEERGEGRRPSRLCVYQAGEDAYLSAARSFLGDAVRRLLDSMEAADGGDTASASWRRLAEGSIRDYIDRPGLQKTEDFLLSQSGRTVLLVGESGTGKSWFLRSLALKLAARGTVTAALFNDLDPRGRELGRTLDILAEQLEAAGVLSPSTPKEKDSEEPARRFLKRLKKASAHRPVAIILDSLDAAADYRAADAQLFQTALPRNVTFLVSARSTADLRVPCPGLTVCELPPLAGGEGVSLLSQLLEKRGRRLQASQRLDAENILSPDVTALEIELLARRCQNLRSGEPFPYQTRPNLQTLVGDILFREGRDDYRTLRRHAVGYLALSSYGLSETELLDLLSQDAAVRTEVERQRRRVKEAEWESATVPRDTHERIPGVLWSILYWEIRAFLTETDTEGAPLMQLRHWRLREEALHKISEERTGLLRIMMAYFGDQGWITGDGTLGNRRKIQEWFPVCQSLGEIGRMDHALGDPLCADAFVRCGMGAGLLDALTDAARRQEGRTDALTDRIQNMRRVLLGQNLLFRLYPDSFLPAALSELRLDADPERDLRKKRLLLRAAGRTRPIIPALTQKPMEQEDASGERELFFPELREDCAIGLRDDGIAAVCQDGQLWLMDTQRGIRFGAVYPVRYGKCSLYWNRGGDTLTVRYEKRRLRFTEENGTLIRQGEETRCRDWGDLTDEKTIPAAGGWNEADAHRRHGEYGETVAYLSGGEVNHRRLFYDPAYSFYYRIHGNLAAILLDGTALEIVNLASGRVVERKRMPGLTGAEWSPSGRLLLTIRQGCKLRLCPVDPARAVDDMPTAGSGFTESQARRVENYIGRMGMYLKDMIEGEDDAVTSPEEKALFGALSLRYGWTARYYCSPGKPCSVCVTLLKGGKRIWWEDTDAIRQKDALGVPLYPARGRNGLILTANGQSVFLDMETKSRRRAAPELLRSAVPEPPIYGTIRETYAMEMAKKLSLPIPAGRLPVPSDGAGTRFRMPCIMLSMSKLAKNSHVLTAA